MSCDSEKSSFLATAHVSPEDGLPRWHRDYTRISRLRVKVLTGIVLAAICFGLVAFSIPACRLSLHAAGKFMQEHPVSQVKAMTQTLREIAEADESQVNTVIKSSEAALQCNAKINCLKKHRIDLMPATSTDGVVIADDMEVVVNLKKSALQSVLFVEVGTSDHQHHGSGLVKIDAGNAPSPYIDVTATMTFVNWPAWPDVKFKNLPCEVNGVQSSNEVTISIRDGVDAYASVVLQYEGEDFHAKGLEFAWTS
ncbi:hypothetical protein MMC21_002015 [Puttea exsequens]|nr:hypothetical protein [Puttea exsequens]